MLGADVIKSGGYLSICSGISSIVTFIDSSCLDIAPSAIPRLLVSILLVDLSLSLSHLWRRTCLSLAVFSEKKKVPWACMMSLDQGHHHTEACFVDIMPLSVVELFQSQGCKSCPPALPGIPRCDQQSQPAPSDVGCHLLESVQPVDRHLRLHAMGLATEAVCDQMGQKWPVHAANCRRRRIRRYRCHQEEYQRGHHQNYADEKWDGVEPGTGSGRR